MGTPVGPSLRRMKSGRKFVGKEWPRLERTMGRAEPTHAMLLVGRRGAEEATATMDSP